jgi:hypothetical protein
MRSSTTVELVGGMGGAAVCARSDAKATSMIAASAAESSGKRQTARENISQAIIATVAAGAVMFRWDLMLSGREPKCPSVARFAKWEIGVPQAVLRRASR